MADEHIPKLPPEAIIRLGQIDMALDEILRELDEYILQHEIDIDETDRAVFIHLIRLGYLKGWEDRYDDLTLGPE